MKYETSTRMKGFNNANKQKKFGLITAKELVEMPRATPVQLLDIAIREFDEYSDLCEDGKGTTYQALSLEDRIWDTLNMVRDDMERTSSK